MTAALTFRNLTLGYDRHPVVHHLEAEIAEGSLTAVVGPNGAGKSTLLKGVIGTLAPLEGRIALGGISRDDIAYLPQQSDIDRSFPISVRDLVAMGLWREIGPFGRLHPPHRDRVAAAIASVGLTGFEDRPIGALSGGQMQRVLFARFLLQEARLVLLDEPFTAIDARTMADLLSVVRRWHGEGRTVIAVLVAEIEALDSEIREIVSGLPEDRRIVVTSHDAFQYFARDYGLTFLSPQGVSTESEASARDVARLIETIRDEGVSAVFFENIADTRLLERIADETGATIGGTLYPGALSEPDGPAPTYLDMMRHNATTLAQALSP